MKTKLSFILLLGFLALPVQASQSVDETHPADFDVRIHFSAVTGDYRFIVGDDDRMEISGHLGDDVEKLDISGDAGRWHIQVRTRDRRGRGWGGSVTNLEIRLPAGASLDARTVSGDIDMSGLSGRLINLATVSGGVRARDIAPEILEVETVSGEIRLNAGGSDSSRLRSVSGNIRAEQVAGRVRVHSVSGTAEVNGFAIEEGEFETVSGRLRLNLEPLERARLNLSAHSGDIHLVLPSATAMDFQGRTFSGSIRSEFGGESVRGRGPGERMTHRTGDGGVRIEAQTFSGRIRLASQ